MTAREERLLTPETFAAVDRWLDEAGVFAKQYTAGVGPRGQLRTVGLRIGEYPTHLIARFGDTVVRHADGSHTVLSAADVAELDRLRARVTELEAYAYGCDAEGCALPHSSWCEPAQRAAAENDGCTCFEGQSHAMHCWKVNPPRAEVEETRRALAERPLLRQPEDPHPYGDPIAYGPTGVRCGCGRDAHSNLTPCLPENGSTTV